jgi:aminoglycoside phosphotransferase (APT) family kinase protein
MKIEDLQARLKTYYVEDLGYPPGTQISNVENIQAGWESDIFAFDLQYGGESSLQSLDLILRIYPGEDAHEKSEREFHSLKLLDRAGYPVPGALFLERQNSPFGQPFIIIERIPGQVLWPLLFSSQGDINLDLLNSFIGLFVNLHQLDWQPFNENLIRNANLESAGIIKTQLGLWRDFYQQFPLPDFLPVFDWLEVHQQELRVSKPAVLHWDFHPENIILRPDDAMVVIDWTGLQVSDPRFDLAWTLMLVTAYEGSNWRKLLLETYERKAGEPIEQLEFFDVAACLRRLYSIAVSVTAGAEQMGMRPGAEATMKNQLEPLRKVYELLLDRTAIIIPMVETWLT